METKLIDGKKIAGEIRKEVSKRVQVITAQGKAAPHYLLC